MKTLCFLLLIPTGLIALVFLFKTLTGTTAGHSSTAEKVVTTIASLLVLGLLSWAYHLATNQDSPGTGIGVVVLSWVVFIGLMLANGLMNTKTWN